MAIIATLRKKAGWAIMILITIAVIGFVVGSDALKRRQRIPPLAVINGQIISHDQFKEQEDFFTEQFRRAQGDDMKITEEDMVQIRSMAWQRLLSEHLFTDACRRAGIAVSKSEMNDMYYGTFVSRYVVMSLSNPQTGMFDREYVKYIINNFDQLSVEDREKLVNMETAIKNERLREKYLTLAGASFYYPTALARQEAANMAPVYTARYVVYPYSEVEDEAVKVNKADYKKFYDENKNRFRQSKNRAIKFVAVDVLPTPEDLQEIERQVSEVYSEFVAEENVGDFVNAVTSGDRFDSVYRNRDEIMPGWDTLFNLKAGDFVAPRRMGRAWQMAKVLDVQMRPDSVHFSYISLGYGVYSQSNRSKETAKRMADSLAALLNVNGNLMAQLAADNSDDPAASQNGGDMGWQKEGQYASFINRAILTTSVGRATVAEGPNGYFVLYVNGKTAPVKKVLAGIVSLPIEPSAATTKERYTLANQFLGQCKGSVENFDSVAARLGLRVRTASVSELDNSLPGVLSAREVVRWAYNDDTKEGRVADRVFEMENRYVVAGLVSINDDDYMSLKKVVSNPNIKGQFEYMVRQDKKFDVCAAKLAAYAGLDETAAGLDINVDTAYGISFAMSPRFPNGAYEPVVVGTLCGMQKGQLSKPVKGNAGVYCIMVDEVESGEVNPMQVQMLKARKESQYRQNAASVLNGALEKVCNIKDNRSFYF